MIQETAPRLAPAHVLVIDDDPDLLRLLSMRLRAWGIRVSTAASAEEGLSRIAIETPQLVISDIRLPGKDGLTLFRELHTARPTLPMILITGHSGAGKSTLVKLIASIEVPTSGSLVVNGQNLSALRRSVSKSAPSSG